MLHVHVVSARVWGFNAFSVFTRWKCVLRKMCSDNFTEHFKMCLKAHFLCPKNYPRTPGPFMLPVLPYFLGYSRTPKNSSFRQHKRPRCDCKASEKTSTPVLALADLYSPYDYGEYKRPSLDRRCGFLLRFDSLAWQSLRYVSGLVTTFLYY